LEKIRKNFFVFWPCWASSHKPPSTRENNIFLSLDLSVVIQLMNTTIECSHELDDDGWVPRAIVLRFGGIQIVTSIEEIFNEWVNPNWVTVYGR
jgi:hypothetical protein